MIFLYNVIFLILSVDDCGSMQGVPVSVVLSGCGRKTFSEVSHHSNKSGSRFNNYPPYSSRQRALVSNDHHLQHTSLILFFLKTHDGCINIHVNININENKLMTTGYKN